MPGAMEVFFLTDSQQRGEPGRDVARDAYRERLIDRIVSKGHGEPAVGIFGAQICQLCGRLDTYSGLYGAMGSHCGPDREFVCYGCRVAHPQPTGLAVLDQEATRAKFVGQDSRHCEICRAQIAGEPRNRYRHAEQERGGVWLCPGCVAAVRATDPTAQLPAVVADLTRRRYVEMTCKTDDDLRKLDLRLELERLRFEEDWAEGAEKARMVIDRAERWRRALEELGLAHGRDYLSTEMGDPTAA